MFDVIDLNDHNISHPGHAMLVGGIGIGIACILIIGMVLSMALFCLID